MANHKALMKQSDAKRLFAAARDAGFTAVSLIFKPTGEVEVRANLIDDQNTDGRGNAWDAELK